MTLDPDRVVGDPRDQGHHDGERDARVQREAHTWDDLEDVSEEDEEEQRGQEGQEWQALRTDHLHDDLLPDELQPHLHDVLERARHDRRLPQTDHEEDDGYEDRKSTRLNSSHGSISYAVFCLKKKKNT